MTPAARALRSRTVASACRFWAGHHGCSSATLERAGHSVTVVSSPLGLSHVLVLRWGPSTVVAGPDHLLPTIRSLVDGATSEVSESALVAGLGDLVEGVVGPTSLAFADESSLRERDPGAGIAVEPTAPDDARLPILARACGQTAWEHSGIGEATSVFTAADRGGAVLSAAGYSILGDSLAHIGAVTHPDHRGRGLAAATGYRAASEAVAAGLVAQWQTLVANRASLAVGRRLGFVELGRRLAIRLRT